MHLQCNFITRYPGIRVRICMNVKKMARLRFNGQSIIKTPTYSKEHRDREEFLKKGHTRDFFF